MSGGRFRVPLRYRARRAVRALVPAIVWSAALALLVTLYMRRGIGAMLTGFASEVVYEVAPDTAGRLKRLEVAVDDDVTKDQIVALLDDSNVLLRLEEARAELTRLKSELDREALVFATETAGTQADLDENLRRFSWDVEQARIQYLRELASQEEDRVRLQGLELNLERSKELELSRLAPARRLDDDRTARDALKRRIEERSTVLADMKRQLEAAKSRHEAYTGTSQRPLPLESSVLVKPLEYAIKAQEVRLEQINLEIVRLVLRAPAAGRVASVEVLEGDVVAAGEPIVQIVEPVSTKVVTYLPEDRMLHVHAGQRVELLRRAHKAEWIPATIRAVGTRVVRLPVRLNPVDQIEHWGLPLHIDLPAGMQATPGEAFDVRFVAARGM